MSKQLKVTLGQINPTIGDMEGNIVLMLSAALEAQAAGSDVIVFPELSLTGYSPMDLLDDEFFEKRLYAGQHSLYAATQLTPGLHWVVGLPLRRQAPDGRPYYNALQVVLNGTVVHTQYKKCLPTYGVFDERRHYEPGPDDAKLVRIKGVRLGFLICEDGWNDAGHINRTAGRELIPQSIIEKPPSAELAPDQKDTDSLPPYEVLDEILKVLIEGKMLDAEEFRQAMSAYKRLQETDEGQRTIQKIQRLIARSEYKRRQAPPVIRVRARAFGTGRQLPLTARQY